MLYIKLIELIELIELIKLIKLIKLTRLCVGEGVCLFGGRRFTWLAKDSGRYFSHGAISTRHTKNKFTICFSIDCLQTWHYQNHSCQPLQAPYVIRMQHTTCWYILS